MIDMPETELFSAKLHWKLQNKEILRRIFKDIFESIFYPNFIIRIKKFFGFIKKIDKIDAKINAAIFLVYDYAGLDELSEEQLINYSNKILRICCDSYNDEYLNRLKKYISNTINIIENEKQ